jgi:multiple sugar transport system permease protein
MKNAMRIRLALVFTVAAGLFGLALPALAQNAGLPAFTSSPSTGGGQTYSLSIQTLLLLTSLTFLPAIVLMIPLYIVIRSVGQLNSLSGVIIAETGFLLPYAILILAPYFDAIPSELEEAARIDGCTRLRAFVHIILPLATPALAACGVIMFIVSWHELLIPLILNARPDFMTLPVVIASLVGDLFIFFNMIMAICLLALAPTVILVGLLQKYIVEGLAAGAVKG